METIALYSPEHSHRLKFVSDWLFKERLQLDYVIITDPADIPKYPLVITYGKAAGDGISIPDSGLLWQKGIQKPEIATGLWNDIPTLFACGEPSHTLPFDIFSAIFFLLSRYEEYLPYKPDKHGRYPPTGSILFKKGWLLRPVADEWVHAFRKQLQHAFKVNISTTPFLYRPTYDIDMAYSHLYKGARRIVGAYIRALLKVDLKQLKERTHVLKKKQKDPFDSFRWLRQLHKEYGCKPVYFVLSSLKTTAFDKNIHPRHPAMVRVIKNLTRDGVVGIHPSYYSTEEKVMMDEKATLEQITGTKMLVSRQHYIRVKTPSTYRMLIQQGIDEDYTMGYGSKLGFRAGTGNSFLWYDLENEQVTQLRIHPFCFMDTTAFYDSRMSVSEAFEVLEGMSRILEKTGSTLVTVFHNFSLGTSSEWKGWRQAYEQFLQEKSQRSQDHVQADAGAI